MAGAEVGPNDIIIHLVNPYKCSDCGSEFFTKDLFVEHLAEHIDKMKAQNPCSQILCGTSLAAQQVNSITVTRDILQINENQMFELQDTPVDYTQLTPLKILEQAGILNLPPPQKVNSNVFQPKMSAECSMPVDIGHQEHNVTSLPQQSHHQDIALIQGETDKSTTTSNLLKSSHSGQGSLPVHTLATNPQNLHPQSVHSANLESIVQQPYIMNDALKEELNVIIEAPVVAPGMQSQEQFNGLHEAPVEGLRSLRNWAQGDVEAIMTGKHIVLVKKVLNPDYEEPRSGRAVCKICCNEFANKNVLMRHQVVHTGMKPHCCFTCFKEFNDSSSLRKHLLIHKRSHKCPVCLKMFLRRRQMEIHLRQHNKKRFIQFGHKYHEVQVLTSRNELEQIVHEFSLSALLNMKSKSSGNGTLNSRNPTSEEENPLASQTSNSLDSDGHVDKSLVSESNFQSQSMAEIQPCSDGTGTSYKKVIYKCGHCKKLIYTRPTLSRHLMLHTNEKPFNCEKCGKAFRHKSDLVHHYKTHLKPVKCQTCGSAFSKRIYLNKHLEKGCPFLEEDSNKFTMLPDLTYQCNLCSKILKNRSTIFRHLRVHAFEARKFQESDTKKIAKTVKDVQGLVEGDDVDTSSQDISDFIQPLKNSVGFQCTICEEEFRFKSFIHIHVRMHLNQRPFKCKECGCGFYGRYQLRKHQQNHTRPYKCPKCGKGFNRRYLMTHHFYKNHNEGSEDKMKDITILSDEKLLRCDICGKTMKSYQKSLMQYHIRMHKDERPYQCKQCQKTFISNIALKKHSLNHKKPYICQVCDKGFSRRYLMLDHFEKNCGIKKQSKKNSLQQTTEDALSGLILQQTNSVAEDEIDSNTPYEAETITEFDEQYGVETFKCVPCDKSFTVKDNLNRHVKTFMKITPCKYCKITFTDKHLTLAHQRCCLGVGVEIKPTSHVRKSKLISQRQEKVLKIMEEMNQKIENYASISETTDADFQNKHGSAHDNEEDKVESLPTCNEGTQCQNDSKSSSSNLRAIKKQTISILKKQNKYPCPECNKTFMTTRGLKIHASSHVRLYKCEICGHDFTQIKVFRDHVKSHNSGDDNRIETGEGVTEKREKAPASFTTENKEIDNNNGSHFAEQNLTETEEKSPQKKSKQATGSAVGQSADVTRHREHVDVTVRLMQSGTRGRPYSCKLCRRRFTEEAGLTAHMSQIHGVENV